MKITLKHYSKKIAENVSKLLSSITVEPVAALFLLALSLTNNASRIMYILKVCYHDFPDYRPFCDTIQNGSYPSALDRVEKRVADIQTIGEI